ncbi:putative HTH-type transcriptional regulator YobS [Paenibacillus nuruki]|uniref:Putative HTH-type transcriptional regulator YobS n=1 Tax=Paenibacillus nuruki TaxID=1886670 RepID=A0A1E3L5S0_9BACL|nr:TetR/AcrR family transcriptional regulator [Paenibacillus nuruki]ODP28525.1 putative HTH-type transcriptional regulator YobS [Paenibacillus nuruki]
MPPRAGLNLQSIVKAATVLADEHGLHEVTLTILAKKLGIRSPSLYNHVNGLPGLRREMALTGLDQLKNVLMYATVGRSEDKAIREMSRAYLEFTRAHPGLYEATLYISDTDDKELDTMKNQVLELFTQVLAGFDLNDDALIHAIRGLRSVLHGFSSLERTGGFGLKVDVNQSFELIIDTFLQGLHTSQ